MSNLGHVLTESPGSYRMLLRAGRSLLVVFFLQLQMGELSDLQVSIVR